MKVFLFYILIAQITWSSEFSNITKLYEKPEFWPPFVSLTESFRDGYFELKQGTRGVLIRLSDNGNFVLADFGRQGVHFVDVAFTDVITEAQKLEQGITIKSLPNLTALFYTRLIKVENGKTSRLTIKEASNVKFFVCIRFNATSNAWKNLSEIIKLKGEDFDFQTVEFILFPEEFELSDLDILEQIKKHGIHGANYMYSFLSKSYMEILWHGMPVENNLIEIATFDANGKLLNYSTASSLPNDNCSN